MLPPRLRLATVVLLVALACFPGLVCAARRRAGAHKLGHSAAGPSAAAAAAGERTRLHCHDRVDQSISCSWFFYRLLPAAVEGPSVHPGALLPP